jgi:hypothetical protein
MTFVLGWNRDVEFDVGGVNEDVSGKEQADYETKIRKRLTRFARRVVDERPWQRRKAGGLEPTTSQPHPHALSGMQQQVGNRGVQRLIAQRRAGGRGEGSFEVDDEIAGRISRERGGGQPVDNAIAARMGEVTGSDLNGVRVHASPEAADLSRQLDARAFTTGQDIFFGDGAPPALPAARSCWPTS